MGDLEGQDRGGLCNPELPPACSPDFNPIETTLSRLKAMLL